MANDQVKQRSGVLAKVQDTAQAVLHDDIQKGKEMVTEAAQSNAFLYPVRGVLFFASHRALWKPLLSKLAAYLTLSVTVTTTMFLTTYLPQVAVLVFTSGPLAVFTTVVLILNESAALTNAIARTWLLDDALLDTYDATLAAKGHVTLLREGRELGSSRDPVGMLGKALKRPFARFSPQAVVRYLMYLPLNFIPVVGTAIFVAIQARSRGRHVHDRYFQLKKSSQSHQKSWLDQHVGSCTSFALVSTVLEMIPLVSIVFAFTSTVGSALWAADLETKSNSSSGSTAPGLREQGKAIERD